MCRGIRRFFLSLSDEYLVFWVIRCPLSFYVLLLFCVRVCVVVVVVVHFDMRCCTSNFVVLFFLCTERNCASCHSPPRSMCQWWPPRLLTMWRFCRWRREETRIVWVVKRGISTKNWTGMCRRWVVTYLLWKTMCDLYPIYSVCVHICEECSGLFTILFSSLFSFRNFWMQLYKIKHWLGQGRLYCPWIFPCQMVFVPFLTCPFSWFFLFSKLFFGPTGGSKTSCRNRIYVAPYSRPVPYSRHPPYSRHFFNDTHENDCVWALFPIAVSGDHFSTQVCMEILSILSIFFGEAS